MFSAATPVQPLPTNRGFTGRVDDIVATTSGDVALANRSAAKPAITRLGSAATVGGGPSCRASALRDAISGRRLAWGPRAWVWGDAGDRRDDGRRLGTSLRWYPD